MELYTSHNQDTKDALDHQSLDPYIYITKTIQHPSRLHRYHLSSQQLPAIRGWYKSPFYHALTPKQRFNARKLLNKLSYLKSKISPTHAYSPYTYTIYSYIYIILKLTCSVCFSSPQHCQRYCKSPNYKQITYHWVCHNTQVKVIHLQLWRYFKTIYPSPGSFTWKFLDLHMPGS